jgi:hypothetical protein
MSSSLTRLLRRLYPRSVRERYGDELLDLQDELRERGEISRAGLIRDAVAGAILARSSGRRASVTVSVVTALAALALTGGLIAGGGLRSSGSVSGAPVAIAKIASPPLPGHVCFLSGSPCSLPACTEYVVVMNPTTGDIVSEGAVAASRRERAACASTPTPRARVLPVARYPLIAGTSASPRDTSSIRNLRPSTERSETRATRASATITAAVRIFGLDETRTKPL